MSLGSIAESFINTLLLDPLGKVVDGVIGRSGSTSLSTRSLTSSSADSLAKIGLAFNSISALSSSSSDGALSSGDASFASNDSTRILKGARSFNNTRNAGMSAAKYSTNVTPNKIAESAGKAYSGALVYPSEIGPYHMIFRFQEYTRPSPFAVATLPTVATVVFPLPGELRESYGAKWDTEEQGTFGDIANAAQTPDNLLRNVAGTTGAAGLRLLRSTGMLAGVSSIVEQFAGAAPNPNLSQTFKGVEMREHTFSWTFSPRTKDESYKILEIVKKIRNLMLPQTVLQNNASLLKYPHIVEIETKPHQYYTFKRCVISGFNVNYSPNGIPSFFEGTKLPVFYSITMNLKEIEYFLSDDQNKNGEDTVAFIKGKTSMVEAALPGSADQATDNGEGGK